MRPLARKLEIVFWVVVAGLLLLRIAPQARAAVGWPKSAGVPAPDVRVPLLAGGDVRLADLKGQVVLVNFWATWCPPCRAEMPGFQRFYTEKHAAGFTVLGISMDEIPPQQVAAWLKDHGITYPIALGTQDAVGAFGGIDAFPTSFLVDRQGRIRYTVHGIFAEFTLRSAVDRLLAERG